MDAKVPADVKQLDAQLEAAQRDAEALVVLQPG